MQSFNNQPSRSPQPGSQQSGCCQQSAIRNPPTSSQQPAAVPVPFITFCSLAVLQQANPERFHKAAASLADGSLAVTITSQSETAIQATARNGSGKEYRLSLNAAGTACSCADALFRHSLCKHGLALALALAVLWLPPTAEPQAVQEAEQPVNLRLGKVRKHFVYPA
jgi:uncharacterized Zn finger protein